MKTSKKLPESHEILILSTRQRRHQVLLDRPVLLVVPEQQVSGVEGLISGFEPPDVDELILVTDEDVEVSGRLAAELQTGSDVVGEKLAEPLVSLQVVVDGAALDVVHLKLDDLLPRCQPLRMGSVLNLDRPGREKTPEETGRLSGIFPVPGTRPEC